MSSSRTVSAIGQLLSNQTLNTTEYGNLSIIQYPLEPPSSILTWTIATMIICTVGCFNNILVLYVTWPRSGDKSGVNLLIFHFIAANLLNCLIHYPIRCVMVQATQSGYKAPLSLCYYIQTFNTVNWLVIYWADAGLSFNRCIALFFPHKYKAFSTFKVNITQLIVFWLGCFGLVLPFDFGIGFVVTVLPIGHCAYRGVKSPYNVVFSTLRNTPYVISGGASLLILWKCYIMSRANNAIGVARSAVRNFNVIRHRIRMALMLVLTFVWTVVCNVPSSVIVAYYPTVFEKGPMANLWLQTAAICQYAFSACILLMSSPKYQERLRRMTQRIVPLDNTLSNNGPRTGHTGTGRSSVRMSALNSISRNVDDVSG